MSEKFFEYETDEDGEYITQDISKIKIGEIYTITGFCLYEKVSITHCKLIESGEIIRDDDETNTCFMVDKNSIRGIK